MEIRAGFEPATNRFAVCPLKPLEYRIMAGIAGLEPAMPVSKTGALTAWLYPIMVVIRAGLEPSITALKGLRPDHLDERTRFAGSCSLLRCPAGISPNEVGLSLADRCHSLSSLNLPPAALASLPLRQECVVTRISSISTLKSAARTIRLSTVGSAAPFCHL